jgi:hypothetical protein
LRAVSHQDPHDLRIRKRRNPLGDADVLGLFIDALDAQYSRIERFWLVRGYSPNRFLPSRVVYGDSRASSTFDALGLRDSDIDLVLTSPPYATALPYIDTDRLSLLVLFGMDASDRRPVEQDLIGSREITTGHRKALETVLEEGSIKLPIRVCNYLEQLHRRVAMADVGFRRKNMPSLLLRFFLGMHSVLMHSARLLRTGAQAMIVIGDNRISIDGREERIATTDFIEEIAVSTGLTAIERIDISVTTENLVHIRNAITKNVVLRLKRNEYKVEAHA